MLKKLIINLALDQIKFLDSEIRILEDQKKILPFYRSKRSINKKIKMNQSLIMNHYKIIQAAKIQENYFQKIFSIDL